MIWDTSRLNVNPSWERTVMLDRRSSSLCASVFPVAQFNTTLAVGTISSLVVRGLIGYLPGSSGSTHTPRCPLITMLPCLNAAPVTSSPNDPTYEITTPTCAIGTIVISTTSTWANFRSEEHTSELQSR